MPLPIIAGIAQARFIFNNGNAPRDATINMHFKLDPTTPTEADLFAAIDANVTVNMWKFVAGGTYIKQVVITKLNGTSSAVVFPTDLTSKWQGQGGSDLILQGCSVVSFPSALRGPSGRNRVYLPWCSETQQQNGVLDSTAVTAAQAAWTAFKVAMATAASGIAVVSPSTSGFQICETPIVRPYLRTQRRRARR